MIGKVPPLENGLIDHDTQKAIDEAIDAGYDCYELPKLQAEVEILDDIAGEEGAIRDFSQLYRQDGVAQLLPKKGEPFPENCDGLPFGTDYFWEMLILHLKCVSENFKAGSFRGSMSEKLRLKNGPFSNDNPPILFEARRVQ